MCIVDWKRKSNVVRGSMDGEQGSGVSLKEKEKNEKKDEWYKDTLETRNMKGLSLPTFKYVAKDHFASSRKRSQRNR